MLQCPECGEWYIPKVGEPFHCGTEKDTVTYSSIEKHPIVEEAKYRGTKIDTTV